MADQKKQVNVDFSNFPELLDDLDQMVKEDGTDRSKLIRKLVKEEKARRAQPNPLPKQPKRRDGRAAQAAAVFA